MYENCRMPLFPKGRSGILANGKEKMDWILASASPRRKELLRELLPSFGVIPARGEEYADLSLPPEEVVKRLAAHKAEEVALLPEARGKAVLGADTVVALGGKILGKPKDEAEALCMLKALSGRVHEVFTGVCVILPDGKRSVRAARTEVEFETLSDEKLEAYIATGSPMDKAGGYGIQDGGLVKRISGSYTNVVGLPLELCGEMLENFAAPLSEKR
ncbi:MAG: Maf family protein [Christensenellaceae bacterium]